MTLPTCYRCDAQPCTCKDGCTLYCGDCLEVMAGMEAGSVQTCVTSPPYWGLRDYGTATWEGGDDACDHIERSPMPSKHSGEVRRDGRGVPYGAVEKEHSVQYREVCVKCGARRIDQQLGLEETPEAYVAKMVEVFRAVRRVLRDDGTLWLNLGDSYNAGTTAPSSASKHTDVGGHTTRSGDAIGGRRIKADSLKPKDLVGIPWRVAFALQADGWYLRQDIIWHKPNPMPESVTDRCTKAHEYIFLLAKSARYYYDAEAVREEGEGYGRSERFRGDKYTNNAAFDNSRDWKGKSRGGGTNSCDGSGRNRRSVWTVTTKPYKGAHFATFPPDLIEPCIKAGCPEGGVVLDPFLGSGTTADVARKNGRGCVGIELNSEYLVLAARRLKQGVLF